jgi:hypothetical protein
MPGEITLLYNGTSFKSEYIVDSFSFTEIYHKDLKPADSSCSLQIPYREDIANFIKTNNNANIMAFVWHTKGMFFGFLRNNYTFEKQQRIQPISLEIVSPSFLLKKNIGSELFWANKNVVQIIKDLIIKAGLGDYYTTIPPDNILNNTVITIFTTESDDTYYDVIKDLLFECGFVFGFNSLLTWFEVMPLFNYDLNPSFTFNNTNIRSSVTQKIKPEKYTGVRINWKTQNYYENILLWETREGETAIHNCVIPIPPYKVWGDDNGIELKYDSGLGEIVYVTNPISPVIQFENGNTSDFTVSVTNQGKSALAIITSTIPGTKNMTKCEIWGNAYVLSDDNITVNENSDKDVLELDFNYIANSNIIKETTKKINEYYSKSDFTYSLQSYENIPLGNYVNIVEAGIGSTVARIIKKEYAWNEPISYELEGISEISFDITSSNTIIANPNNGNKPVNLGTMAGIIGTTENSDGKSIPDNYWVLQDLAGLQDESEDGSVYIYQKGDFYIGDEDSFIRLYHTPTGKAVLEFKADRIHFTTEFTEVIGDLQVAGILNPAALIIPVYASNPSTFNEGQTWILRESS